MRKSKYHAYHITKTCLQLGITEHNYKGFKKQGDKLRKIYTQNCNGELTDEQYNNKTDKIYNETDTKTANLGLYIYYQTDPRGATIYLDTKPINDTRYIESYCIY